MTGSVARTAVLALALAIAGCGGRGAGPLGPQYEYEEDLTLRMDGSATLTVNASAAALVLLRGLDLPTDLKSRADQLKEQVRAIYTSDQTRVTRVSTWTRQGRRFVGVTMRIDNVRTLETVPVFAWARYDLHEEGDQVVYRQKLSPPKNAKTLPMLGLTGDEIVAYRLHLPARIRFQNSRWLDRDESRPAARGNIITWEQRLVDRAKGEPIAYAEDKTADVMEVRMDKESILYRTLWLFGLAFAAALLVLAGLIWFTMRRGAPETDARVQTPDARRQTPADARHQTPADARRETSE
jgi:hypothetical protein